MSCHHGLCHWSYSFTNFTKCWWWRQLKLSKWQIPVQVMIISSAKWHFRFSDGISHHIHYSSVIVGAMTSQITNLTMFTQPFIQAQIKENIKAPHHWPLCRKFTDERWIPRTKGQLREKCFHVMTSSWGPIPTCVSISTPLLAAVRQSARCIRHTVQPIINERL